MAFVTGKPAVRQILAYPNERSSLICVAPVRGRQLCETVHAGQGTRTLKPNRHCRQWFTNSISATCGEDSLTRIRSRSTGTLVP
jgi:hypothetical protein